MTSTIVEEPSATYRYVRYYKPSPYYQYSSRDEWLAVLVDSPDDPIVTLSGMVVFGHTILNEESITRARERTPFDDPPGIGYNALVLQGSYIADKPYRLSNVTFDSSEMWRSSYHYGNKLTDFHALPNIQSLFDVSGAGPDGLWGLPDLESQKKSVINLYGSLQRRRDFNLGVFMAELKESLGLLGKSMLTITEVVLALKKGRVSDAISALKKHGGGVTTRKRLVNRSRENRLRRQRGEKPISAADYAANMWLELQFGWLPILSDIHDLIKVMQGSLDNGDGILGFNGFGETDFENDISTSVSALRSISGGAYHYENCSAILSGKGKIRTNYHATYRVSDDVLDILAQLGLTNPLSIAWEVVPFSFVVDWFIPIGNWIDSMQADAGLELLSLNYSRKIIFDGELTVTFEDLSYSWSQEDGHQSIVYSRSGDLKIESFERHVNLDDELPDMPLPHLTFDEILDPWKAVTALALLK